MLGVLAALASMLVQLRMVPLALPQPKALSAETDHKIHCPCMSTFGVSSGLVLKPSSIGIAVLLERDLESHQRDHWEQAWASCLFLQDQQVGPHQGLCLWSKELG